MRFVLSSFLIALLGTASAAQAATYLQFKSSTGDWVGQGAEWTITPDDGTITLDKNFERVRVRMEGPDYWTLIFQGPNGQLPTVGSYENVVRAAGVITASPRMDVYGDGRGCNQLHGRFDVLALDYAPDGTPVRFAVDFVQHCENSQPPLIGSVRYDVDMPYPAFTCGDGIVEGPEQCEPATANASDCCATACAYESVFYACHAAVGGCDAPELCTGTSTTCPSADLLRPAGAVCRPANFSCDIAETCDGTSTACPANQFVPGGTVCRASTAVCDAVEICTGSSQSCPANLRLPSTAICRPAAGGCDAPEYCPGTSTTCPANSIHAPGVICRAAVGICDVPEACEGTSIACPFDGGIATTPACRPASGVCDVAEHCDGTNGACPQDTGGGSIAVCRPASGICDVAESCDGTSGACPADTFATASATCRASAGICDVAEVCAGTATGCPVDLFATSLSTCRASVGSCDIAERCSGAMAACPSDSFVADGFTCDDGAFCNGADRCSSGLCSVHDGSSCSAQCAQTCNEATDLCFDAAQTPCASDGDPCTDDVCDGAGRCGVENTAPCDDGDACTSGDRCSAGTCVGGGLPPECDDGNPCTLDTCDLDGGCVHTDRPADAVTAECDVAARAKIKLVEHGDASSIVWQFGPQVIDADYAALGSPDVDTVHGLCVYDSTGFVPRLVASYVVRPSSERWRGRDPKGWSYRDRDGTSDGVTKLQLRTGLHGRIKLAASGPNLALPGPVVPTYFDADTYVEIDFVSSTGRCWAASYNAASTKRNDASGFSASFTFGD